MAYRDASAALAHTEQVESQLAEAHHEVRRLQTIVDDQRQILRRRGRPDAGPKILAAVGLGSLCGNAVGTCLWYAMDNVPIFFLATVLGALLFGLGSLAVANTDDGVSPAHREHHRN